MNDPIVDTPTSAVSPFNRKGIEDSQMFAKPPRIADCTLRDGEQQPGLVFSWQDKVAIAKLLDAAGVDDLEVATPAVSEDDQLAMREIASLNLRADMTALARADKRDVDLVASCGASGVRVSLPISQRQREAKLHLDDDAYVQRALDICTYAKNLGLQVIFSPYDTTRADLGLLERVLRELQSEGCADRIRLVDTVGAATPQSVTFLVGFMREVSGDIPIEVHCHDDFGLAVANTVAGAIAGAAYVSVTVNGLGERAGNAALEEVIAALKIGYGVDLHFRTELLKSLSEEVERRSEVRLQDHKSVVGRNCFVHETGTIVAGLLRDPFAAEAYNPTIVGQHRSIVLGKMSGSASVEYKLRELGMSDEHVAVREILSGVKERAVRLKRGLSDDEFVDLVAELGHAKPTENGTNH